MATLKQWLFRCIFAFFEMLDELPKFWILSWLCNKNCKCLTSSSPEKKRWLILLWPGQGWVYQSQSNIIMYLPLTCRWPPCLDSQSSSHKWSLDLGVDILSTLSCCYHGVIATWEGVDGDAQLMMKLREPANVNAGTQAQKGWAQTATTTELTCADHTDRDR